jgi:hypothetical protein
MRPFGAKALISVQVFFIFISSISSTSTGQLLDGYVRERDYVANIDQLIKELKSTNTVFMNSAIENNEISIDKHVLSSDYVVLNAQMSPSERALNKIDQKEIDDCVQRYFQYIHDGELMKAYWMLDPELALGIGPRIMELIRNDLTGKLSTHIFGIADISVITVLREYEIARGFIDSIQKDIANVAEMMWGGYYGSGISISEIDRPDICTIMLTKDRNEMVDYVTSQKIVLKKSASKWMILYPPEFQIEIFLNWLAGLVAMK